jgi:SAM-dependent methyltransferase
LLHKLRDLLRLPARLLKLTESINRQLKSFDARLTALEKDLRSVHGESRRTRTELRDRLLQYNLQLGRLSRARGGRTGRNRALSWRSVPLEVDDGSAPGWNPVGDGKPAPDPEGLEWLVLDACPVCGHGERTLVNEFNKLVLLTKAPDATAARYDYAICHACGMMFATRRPSGERYRYLLANFGEVTNKAHGDAEIKSPLLNPYPLSEDDRVRLTWLASKGVWVSDHLQLRKGEYLEALVKDRFENSVHLDLLGALVAPKQARVLEIRPRAGTISEGLRRLFGAEVHAMPIWESQKFLLKAVYDIDSSGLIDYDQFDIPFDGTFDLIICNHMLTHVVRPGLFFDVLLQHLSPGGHVYFFNEPDDAEFLRGTQSMLASLNPLHLQAFDQPSLVRALAARGLDVVFMKSRNFHHMCLARRGEPAFVPMTEKQLAARVRAYQRARDKAVLALPPELRGRFAGEWQQIVERGVAEGLAEFDEDGTLKLVGRPR